MQLNHIKIIEPNAFHGYAKENYWNQTKCYDKIYIKCS